MVFHPQQRVLYASRALLPAADRVALQRLLGAAQVRNRRSDLTGVLAFTGRHFLQVLEGPQLAIDPLLEALARDPRHGGMRLLARLPIDERLHGRWSMALVENADHADAVEGLLAAEDLAQETAQRIAANIFRGADDAPF